MFSCQAEPDTTIGLMMPRIMKVMFSISKAFMVILTLLLDLENVKLVFKLMRVKVEKVYSDGIAIVRNLALVGNSMIVILISEVSPKRDELELRV